MISSYNLQYEKIHWWQFPLMDFSIKFNDAYKKKFFNRIYYARAINKDFSLLLNAKSKKYSKGWNLKRQRQLIWQYKHNKFIPAWFIYEVANYLNYNLSEIEENIGGYISFRGKVEIMNPILPVKVTPEFSSIFMHIMCDGHYSERGKFYYDQADSFNLRRFQSLLKNVFGNYDFNYKKGHYAPKIFASIITNYYKINHYSTFRCRFPGKIFNQSRSYKLAILAAFLIDEGHSLTHVSFSSSNKNFLLDLKKIAQSLGYKCNSLIVSLPDSNNKLKSSHYKFTLSAFSLEKFYLDLKSLFAEFPSLHIGKKFINIEKSIQIKNRGWNQRGKGETKEIILKALKEKKRTAYELRYLTQVSMWTVYHHLQQLMKNKLITKNKLKNKRFNYQLI